MPNVPYYIEGIINLRGSVVPIISLRRRFGLSDIDNTIHTRIMVMCLDNQSLVGFVVDKNPPAQTTGF